MEEAIKKMNTDQLCEWISNHSGLNDPKRIAVVKFFKEQDIEGIDFLEISKAEWESKGLCLGVSTSLVRIAQSILNNNRKRISADDQVSEAMEKKTKVEGNGDYLMN
jgi:hypothetical protein